MFIEGFKKQGQIGKILDTCMVPVMYLLQGNFNEVPQRTHRWNNAHLSVDDIGKYDESLAIHSDRDELAVKRWFGFIPLFHMPLFGGWKKFVVVKPVNNVQSWHVGWRTTDAFGLSKVPISDCVRLGIGPDPAEFFAIDSNGEQIAIRLIGEGHIGRAGEFSSVPLL